MMTEYDRMVKELRAAGHNVGGAKPRAKTTRQIVREEIQAYADKVLVPAIAKAIGTLMRESDAKIKELECAQLKHVGPWEPGAYKRGSVVTAGGSAFTALHDTDTKPGTSAAWSLLAARGRDGRDGRDGEPAQRTTRSQRAHST